MKPESQLTARAIAAPFYRSIKNQWLLVPLLAMTVLILAACTQTSAPPNPGAQAAATETSILEEGRNINLALREAQNGRGPSIVGDPTAVYGKIMTYTAAFKAGGSNARDGESQAWKFDRLVYLYVFEGDIADGDPRTSSVTDWAQKVVIFDAETGSPFGEITHREPGRLDVSQFLPLRILDSIKGVPPREIKNLNRPPPVAVPVATFVPRAPDETLETKRSPDPNEDSANLASDPQVTTVMVGQVIERVGEETVLLEDSESSVRFGFWRVSVERYLVDAQPYREILVRLEEMFVQPDGTLRPTRFPVGLNPGGQAVFFLTRNAGPNRPPMEEDTFGLVINGPEALGRWTIQDGQVNTMLAGQGRREPLDDFIARIIRVASEAGRTTGDLTTVDTAAQVGEPSPRAPR